MLKKSPLFALLILLFASHGSVAQVEFGIKAGLNSIDLITDDIIIGDGSYEIQYRKASYGHHFGIYTRLKIFGIYAEPAAIFNSNTVTYNIKQYSENGVIDLLRNETYNKLDVPLMIGVKAGIVRIFGGPVAHIHIGSTSDLLDINGYSRLFKDAEYGYQAGFGLDIKKVRLEIAYEGNLSNFGNHISFGGQKYSFSDAASRLIGSVGYAF